MDRSIYLCFEKHGTNEGIFFYLIRRTSAPAGLKPCTRGYRPDLLIIWSVEPLARNGTKIYGLTETNKHSRKLNENGWELEAYLVGIRLHVESII